MSGSHYHGARRGFSAFSRACFPATGRPFGRGGAGRPVPGLTSGRQFSGGWPRFARREAIIRALPGGVARHLACSKYLAWEPSFFMALKASARGTARSACLAFR